MPKPLPIGVSNPHETRSLAPIPASATRGEVPTLSADMERLPEEAKGKTSKRKSKTANKYGCMISGTMDYSKMPGKAQERTFRGVSVPVIETEFRNVTTTQDKSKVSASVVYNPKLPEGTAQRYEYVKQGTSLPNELVPAPDMEYIAKAEGIAFIDGKVVSTGIVEGDTFTVTGRKENKVTYVNAPPTPHKPVISASSPQEARHIAKTLRQPDAIGTLKRVNDNGYTGREAYAQSLGIDVEALRAKGDVRAPWKGKRSTALNKNRATWNVVRTYAEELERKIAIREAENTPYGQDCKRRELQRKLRRQMNEENRLFNEQRRQQKSA